MRWVGRVSLLSLVVVVLAGIIGVSGNDDGRAELDGRPRLFEQPAGCGVAARRAQDDAREMRRPLLAVVGASFASGVGANQRHVTWPRELARRLDWRLAVSANPGSGFLNPGAHRRGAFARLANRLDLARLDPQVVLIQGGHNDIGRPLGPLRERVRNLVDSVERRAPQARIGVVTVFPTGNRPTRAARVTDRAIVAAARRADPGVMVFDPIGSHWRFPRVKDRLHPSPAGHRWLGRHLFAGLHRHGAVPPTDGAPRPPRPPNSCRR